MEGGQAINLVVMLQLMPLDLLLSLLQLEKAKTQAKNCFCEKHSPIIILLKRNVSAFDDVGDSGLEKLRNLLTIYLLFQKIIQFEFVGLSIFLSFRLTLGCSHIFNEMRLFARGQKSHPYVQSPSRSWEIKRAQANQLNEPKLSTLDTHATSWCIHFIVE